MIRSQISDSYNRDIYLSPEDDLESRSSNLDPSICRLKSSEPECLSSNDSDTQGGKEEVKTTLNCSQMDASIHNTRKIDEQKLGAAAAAAAYRFNYRGSEFNIGDQYLHTSCQRRNCQNQSLEMLLEVTLLLSSVHAAGAYAFGQMIRIREPDPNSKSSLEAFIALFAASFLCTFLGALMLLIIVSSRKYYQYKKLCLVISNTASFALMMTGYCFVVAFNM